MLRTLAPAEAEVSGDGDDCYTAVFGQDRELRYVWAIGSVFGASGERVMGKRDSDLLGRAGDELILLKRRVIDRRPVRQHLRLPIDRRRGAL